MTHTRIMIYDVEVFEKDWVFVACTTEPHPEYVIIHNDNYQLKMFLEQPYLLLGGFNNKHYDDGIIHAIYHGADVDTVKRMNDFIILEKGRWWDFPFVNFKKKVFDSFDLRDDLPINLSLKAIEGNLGRSIVESSVDFNIGRKLTKEELSEVENYCCVDVKNTVELYHERQSYLESKKAVAKLKGLDEWKAMGLTNAKLTAEFLDAKKVIRSDEFDYPIPDTLDIGRYQEVLDFFNNPIEYTLSDLRAKHEKATNARTKKSLLNKIEKLETKRDVYECNLELKVAGAPHVYAWGGIHGALPKYFDVSDDKHNIVTIDVASYYPSMMLEYNYISRNIPSAKGYADIYHKRMHAKATGDSKTSDALKLVLNTCYGAMKNQYNNLYDPRNANAICVGGQLLLTDLIDKMQDIPGFTLIQSNTDGLIIKYQREHEPAVFDTVGAWETRTRLNMEYTDIHVIAQKDVNNYVMKAGEVYLVKNGVKEVLKPDKGYITTKGGYVSMYGGGDFKNNSLVILHDALVNYFMNGVPVEETIMNETDIMKFQIIAKTGSTYQGTYHEVNGLKMDVQKVNRVYAIDNSLYGTVKKVKANGREDKIAGLPDQCYIDNRGVMSIDDIDRDFYIETAKARIVDYVGKRNADKQIQLNMEDKTAMTTKKTSKAAEQAPERKLNIFEKINAMRLDFANLDIKKNGVNMYAEYKYFTLDDIVPAVLNLSEKYNVTGIFNFGQDEATLTIYDNDAMTFAAVAPIDVNVDMMKVVFTSPMAKQAMPKGGTEVQNLGAVQTYLRRYLYLAFLDIVESDEVEATTGKDDTSKASETKSKVSTKSDTKKSNRPATPKERETAKKEVINKDGEASETQIKSIKNGLKKLREKGTDHEGYIKEIAMKIRSGIDKTEAESLLLEIGEKVKS